MKASHILLERSWQYYKRDVHDGFTNLHTFAHKKKHIILAPLTPQEVHPDQLQLLHHNSILLATSSETKDDFFNQQSMILMINKEVLPFFF